MGNQIYNFYALISSENVNKIKENKEIKSVTTINPVTLDYDNKFIYCYNNDETLIKLYDYIKKTGKRISVIGIKAEKINYEIIKFNLGNKEFESFRLSNIYNYTLINISIEKIIETYRLRQQELNKTQAPVQQANQINNLGEKREHQQNKQTEQKYTPEQVFSDINKVYNFFIHIPKWLWSLIIGLITGWALHGLIERYSFPCIIISFVLLVVAILIIILLTIFLGNKNNKPKQ